MQVAQAVGAHAAALTQTLDWKPCLNPRIDPGLPSAYYRVQCTTMVVPMDWNDTAGTATLDIAVTRLLASTKPAAGVLFTNPGGPGGAGADMPLMFISAGRRVLIRTQDVYGMDVRGSGNSTNVTCGGPVAPYLDPRDRSAANVDLLLDSGQFTARACDIAGGALLDHITTWQTVRDYELLRVLTGAEKINWLGYSAGTWLGAQYATAFPSRVNHFVLDSNTDFTTNWQTAFRWQAMGFERRFREDFLPWAARYNSTFRLGTTPEEVRQRYEEVRAAMTPDAPVTSAVSIDQLLASTMYDSALFPIAAQVLADLRNYLQAVQTGNLHRAQRAMEAIQRAGPLLQRDPRVRNPMSSDTSDAAFLAVTCNDTEWPQDRSSLAVQSQHQGDRYPLVGWSTIYEPCAFWARPPATPLPTITGDGLPPVLLVQSEHDPATPIEGAQDALAHFSAGHMLTVTNSGDHGLYAGLNGCVNRAVEAFLIHGKLPAATCTGHGLPDPDGGLSLESAQAATAGAAASSSSAPPLAADKTELPAEGTNPLVALNMIRARIGS
jgi:pimeloyl-ACP methyl ester carboxylesterase